MSYTRVNWENLPSTNTPLNATNLNKMDKGIADLYPTNWTNATLTSKLKGTGIIRYNKIGNIVIVNFADIEANSSIASHADILATGLPNSNIYLVSALFNYATPSKPIRIAITTDGKVQTHYSNDFTASEATAFYGTIVYITNQ